MEIDFRNRTGTGGGGAGVLSNQAEKAHEKAAVNMTALKRSNLKPTVDVSAHRSTAVPVAAATAGPGNQRQASVGLETFNLTALDVRGVADSTQRVSKVLQTQRTEDML